MAPLSLDRRLFTRPAPWAQRLGTWRAALLLLGVYAGLRLLFELPADRLKLAAINVATAELALRWLAALGVHLLRDGQMLVHAQGFVTEVHQNCTALIPAALLAGAILLHPRAGPGHKLAGLAVCLPLVALVNQLRLVGVVWVGVQAPQRFELVHVWLAPALLVASGVLLWWAWARWAAPRQ